MHYKSDIGKGSSHKDSVSIITSNTMKQDSIKVSALELELDGHQDTRVELTSGELWFPNMNLPNKEKLKIVTIKNTKVISKTLDMSDGRVVYKIPEKMKIRNISQVLLRISKSKAILSVFDSLEGTVMTSEIPVTQTMKVSLIDPSPEDNKAFLIVPDNESVQLIDSGDTYTEWSWNVTPIRVGNYNLKIVVSVVRNGMPKAVVYEDVVKVEIDIPTQLLFFWNKYWQWIIGTFILPFIIWFYRKKKEERDEKKKRRK